MTDNQMLLKQMDNTSIIIIGIVLVLMYLIFRWYKKFYELPLDDNSEYYKEVNQNNPNEKDLL